ncbi:ComF family protein [Candidatus Wolfebacteria bacterium]|nr:ComF family protein [Candidatus Wolfebacteria bacterium]
MFLFLIKAKNILLDIFFPPVCFACQKHLAERTNADSPAKISNENSGEEAQNNFLCEECLLSIKLNNSLFCPVCRARIPEFEKICHFNSKYLLAAATNYNDPVIQNLIHYFKYKGFENIAPFLSEVLIKYTESVIRNLKPARPAGGLEIRNFLIIPIPLHPSRQRERGFNQSELLAKNIAVYYSIPLINNLKRIRKNEHQVSLKDYGKRIKNIAGCFSIKNPEEIAGKNIILIDDVFTSGATMNEAVEILKSAGARKIIALVLAKA